MSTKQLPPILALVAGFMTCIMSFVQGVDMTVFARRFIIVTILFFVIGTVLKIVIDLNFKTPEEEDAPEEAEPGKPQKENIRTDKNGKESKNGNKKKNGEEEV